MLAPYQNLGAIRLHAVPSSADSSSHFVFIPTAWIRQSSAPSPPHTPLLHLHPQSPWADHVQCKKNFRGVINLRYERLRRLVSRPVGSGAAGYSEKLGISTDRWEGRNNSPSNYVFFLYLLFHATTPGDAPCSRVFIEQITRASADVDLDCATWRGGPRWVSNPTLPW